MSYCTITFFRFLLFSVPPPLNLHFFFSLSCCKHTCNFSFVIELVYIVRLPMLLLFCTRTITKKNRTIDEIWLFEAHSVLPVLCLCVSVSLSLPPLSLSSPLAFRPHLIINASPEKRSAIVKSLFQWVCDSVFVASEKLFKLSLIESQQYRTVSIGIYIVFNTTTTTTTSTTIIIITSNKAWKLQFLRW